MGEVTKGSRLFLEIFFHTVQSFKICWKFLVNVTGPTLSLHILYLRLYHLKMVGSSLASEALSWNCTGQEFTPGSNIWHWVVYILFFLILKKMLMPYVNVMCMPNFPTEELAFFNTSASTAVKMATGQNRKPINPSPISLGELGLDWSICFPDRSSKGYFLFQCFPQSVV